MNVAGKQALVTGAGSGIGAALCRALDGAGAHVVCTDIDEHAAEATAAGADAGVFGGSDWTVGFRNFELQLRAEGGNLFTDDGEPGFDRERLAAFWEQGTALRDGAAVSAQRVEELSPLTPFDSAVTASELQWDNFGASYVQNLGVEPEHIALVAPPTLIEGSKDMFLKSSMMYTIAANTEHPDEAALLIDFLVNDPEVSIWGLEGH